MLQSNFLKAYRGGQIMTQQVSELKSFIQVMTATGLLLIADERSCYDY